jgi:hypothetical protein
MAIATCTALRTQDADNEELQYTEQQLRSTRRLMLHKGPLGHRLTRQVPQQVAGLLPCVQIRHSLLAVAAAQVLPAAADPPQASSCAQCWLPGRQHAVAGSQGCCLSGWHPFAAAAALVQRGLLLLLHAEEWLCCYWLRGWRCLSASAEALQERASMVKINH